MGRVDIHFHVLPGVDDGPSTVEDSIELARAALADGTTTVVATPHVRPEWVTDVSEIAERVDELRARLAEERVPIALVRGAELGHTMVGRLTQTELDAIALGPPTRRWLLLEAPFAGIDADFTAAADELRDRGFGVVVAHPERAAATVGAALRNELEQGSVMQVNAWSLAGRHGGEAREAALGLLRDGAPVVVASDAHGGWRMPALGLAIECLVDGGWRGREAERLVGSGPWSLLERGVRTALRSLA